MKIKPKVVHCKKEPYDIYCGRPSCWANSFVIGKDGTREEVVEKYRKWILTQPQLLSRLPELAGKIISCWCAPLLCHCDVLSELIMEKIRFEKVISGGQDGADIAALKAAKHCGILTSGYMPKGWMTQSGRKPEYAEVYSMLEHPEWGYPARTEGNAKYSDGTIRFASDFYSPGELCTLKFIKKYNKPHLDLDLNYELPHHDSIIQWIIENDIRVLNVAGNTEKTSPGIEKIVYEYLCAAFKEFKAYD